jgi:hypothetical protein
VTPFTSISNSSGRATVVPQPSPYGIGYTGGVANRL